MKKPGLLKGARTSFVNVPEEDFVGIDRRPNFL